MEGCAGASAAALQDGNRQLALLPPALVLGGRGQASATRGKLELTTIPDAEWKQVEDEALKFWDEIASQSPRSAKVVEILKNYDASMKKAGAPYRYG